MFGIFSVSAQEIPKDSGDSVSLQLDEKAQEIKNQVVKIGEKNDITIIGKNNQSYYGSVLEIKDDSVSINEIDKNVITEVNYKQIKKVRKGYGNAKNRSGNRKSNRRNILAFAGLAAVILIPVIFLAAAKD